MRRPCELVIDHYTKELQFADRENTIKGKIVHQWTLQVTDGLALPRVDFKTAVVRPPDDISVLRDNVTIVGFVQRNTYGGIIDV